MSESVIEIRKNGKVACYAGSDATNLARARILASSLRFYAKTGMKVTRTASPTQMIKMAEEFTKKKYKGKDRYTIAAADLEKWCNAMASALPVVVREA